MQEIVKHFFEKLEEVGYVQSDIQDTIGLFKRIDSLESNHRILVEIIAKEDETNSLKQMFLNTFFVRFGEMGPHVIIGREDVIRDIENYEKYFFSALAKNYKYIRHVFNDTAFSGMFFHYPMYIERETEDGFIDRDILLFHAAKLKCCILFHDDTARVCEGLDFILLMRKLDLKHQGQVEKFRHESEYSNKNVLKNLRGEKRKTNRKA